MSDTPEQKALAALNEYKVALKDGNTALANAASDKFRSLVSDASEPTRRELKRVHRKLMMGDLQAAIKAYAEVAAKIAGAADAFELGKKMAEDGQAGLFFPFVAGELSEIVTTVAKLRELADQVIAQVEDLPDSIDASSAQELVDEGLEAKLAVDDLISKLGEVKAVLES